MSEKEKTAALPPEERKWLTEFIAPIILPEEQKVFLELAEPYQREQFKNAFWERRERSDLQPPLGPGYRYRYEELRRQADEVYDGWRQDAGRMILRFGEPASVDKAKDCGETFRELEIWTYNGGTLPRGSHYFFYRPFPGGPRKMWTMMDRQSDVFLPNACRKSFDELVADCPESPSSRASA